MALDREAIAAAIVARVQAACPIIPFVTRSPVEFATQQATMQPVALVLCGEDKAQREQRKPPVWTLTVQVNVCAKNQTSPASPDTQLNALALQVEAAFERQATEATADKWQTTLGGLVERCWVTDVLRRQGQDEGEVVIMLEILAVGP